MQPYVHLAIMPGLLKSVPSAPKPAVVQRCTALQSDLMRAMTGRSVAGTEQGSLSRFRFRCLVYLQIHIYKYKSGTFPPVQARAATRA